MTVFNRRQFINSTLFISAHSSRPSHPHPDSPPLGRRLKKTDRSRCPWPRNSFCSVGAGANVVARRPPDGLCLRSTAGLAKPRRVGENIPGIHQAHRVGDAVTPLSPEQTGFPTRRSAMSGGKIIAHTNTKRGSPPAITVGWRAGPYGPFTGQARPERRFTPRPAMPTAEPEYG